MTVQDINEIHRISGKIQELQKFSAELAMAAASGSKNSSRDFPVLTYSREQSYTDPASVNLTSWDNKNLIEALTKAIDENILFLEEKLRKLIEK